MLKNELFYITNHFICYSFQKLSSVVYRLNSFESFNEYSLDWLTAVLMIFPYLKQIVGYIIECIVIYLAARYLVKLRLNYRT